MGSAGGLSLPRPLGAYLLLEEIGRGGNGVVFKARQPVLNRLCAVKMLLGGEFAGPDAEARLRTEAAAAASLDHPHIVGIYEAGVENGLLYFSMEYVPGHTLNQLVRANMLPAEKIARYVRDIARAIDYAHSRGVLHRDLKPTNVIIDGNDQVQITDFGLTKGVHEADHTTDGAGSPNFMAPEQASAAFGQTGVRTDVFGIGAILYFLLTDRPPFRCETLAATLQAVIHTDPKRPREFRTGVPRDLETICMKCLEKRPARRYATAGEVADELDRFLRDEPILAHPVGPLERGWRWCRRHPALAGFATATAVLLGTLAVGGPAMALRLRHQRDFTRRNLYAADMAAAFQSLEGGGERQVHELLDRYRPENQDGLDLRGWEWFHLAHRTRDRSVALIGTNEATPTVLRLLPDGKRALVADFGGRLALWELGSRKKVWSRVVRTNASSMFVVSTDGRLACVIDRLEGSTNTQVRVLDAESGAPVAEHRTPGLATPFAVTRDGTVWLQAGRELRRMGIRDGRPGASLLLRTNATDLAVALSPDGRWIAAALEGNELQILPAEADGASRFARDIHRPGPIGAGAVAVAFSPDSSRVATCGRDGSVGIWSVPDARLIVRLQAHPDLVVAADFSGDGSRIVTGGRDSAIRVWSLPDGALVSEQTGRHSLLRYAVVLPGGREFVTTADDNAIRLWNLQPEPDQTVFTNIPARVVAVGLIPDGRHYGWARADGTGGFAEIATGKTFMTGGSDNGAQVTGAAAASPDGRVLMARLLADGRVQLANIEKGPLTEWRIPNWSFAGQGQGGQVQLDISRDLRHLAVADPVQGIGVFEAQTGRALGRFQSPGFLAIALAPKQLRVAHSGRVGGPRIRDLATGVDLEMKAEAGFRQNIAFSPDGRHLLTAGLDGVVHVFDSGTGALVHRLTSRATGLIYVSASHDGSRVAAGSVDGVVSLWDMQTGRAIGTLSGHRSPVGSIEFLPDGRLVTGGSDSIRFWPAPGWVGSAGSSQGR
jgi:WD40 repeat protein/tRNA A-37 threonylcarbamoyl transferase component Bud32